MSPGVFRFVRDAWRLRRGPLKRSPRYRRRGIRRSLEAFEARTLLSVNISVDAGADQHAIDARIYGVAYADAIQLADLNAPLNRSGGNKTSTYNWQQNADSTASDFYF